MYSFTLTYHKARLIFRRKMEKFPKLLPFLLKYVIISTTQERVAYKASIITKG